MDFVRKDTVLGNKKVIVGDKYTDLVLETLGKIYVKTGNKSQVLDQLISTLIQNADTPKTILVNNEQEMNTMRYPGDGTFIYNKLNNSLYMALDNRYVLILQVKTDETPKYVNKDGDTMTGPLEIATVSAPLIVHSSLLIENLNAEYLNNYSSDDLAKKKINEVIYGNWTFDSQCQANNNWIFKENTRFYKDIVTSGNLSSSQFAGGFGGYGWMLDANTNTLTVDNLVVRKAMQVYEMVINQISATNGSLWVSNSTKVETVYRPYLITKEELDAVNTGTKEEINAKLNGVLWNNSYFLITDLGLTINQDTNNLGVSEEQNIGIVTEDKGLSSANNINIIPKEFVNFKYVIWIGDLNEVLDDENFPGVTAFYDENYLFNVNTNLNLKAYYLSKEIQVSEWNEDNTPKVSHYLSTFNKGLEIFIKPRDSEEVVGLKPYYKYFALSKDQINSALAQHVNDEVKKVPVPTIYIIDSDSDMNPTLKAGDIIRCQKFEENNIKYYDAIVTSHFKSKGYILQKAASVFDTYTEITYNDNGEVESRTEIDNSTLYNKTEQSYNTETGEYQSNYPTTEKVADVAADDDIVQMGNIYNTQRQNAIYITSTDDQGPYIDIMSGLNRPDYSVIYDQPVYKQIKVFIKQKGDIFVQGEPYSYYYQKQNPGAINFNQKPAYITRNTKKYPLVYITVDSDLNVTGTYINDGETNNIPASTSAGYFITNYPTQYSIKTGKITGTKITKVRLGNLDGIYNETFGNKQPYGFGMYGENVFLTGEFYLNNGQSVVDFSKDYIDLQVKPVQESLDQFKEETNQNFIEVNGSITDLSDAISDFENDVNTIFKDGIISEAEAISISKYINQINESFQKLNATYAEVYNNSYLDDANRTNLKSKYDDLIAKKDILVNTINRVIQDQSVTSSESAEVDAAFNDYNTSSKNFQTAVEQANEFIQNKLKSFSDAAQATAEAAKSDAAHAQQVADSAQSSANVANSLLQDIANDNKLTPQEKQQTKKEWDIIVSEKPLNDSSADKFGIDKTNYTYNYNALNSYITPLLSDLSTTSNINGETFRTQFKNYYDSRTTLLNTISEKAKQIADAAQTTADEAKIAAQEAQSVANEAKDKAIIANELLADIASDNKLTPQEKQQTKKEWDIIVSEKPLNDAQADKFGIDKSTYNTTYQALSTYITPLLSNLNTTSDISGNEFRTKFKDYYDSRTNLLNAVSEKAKQIADNISTGLLATGINIQDKSITLTANTTTIQTNSENPVAIFTLDENGNPYLKANFIRVDTLNFSKLLGHNQYGKNISINQLGLGEQVLYWSDGSIMNCKIVNANSEGGIRGCVEYFFNMGIASIEDLKGGIDALDELTYIKRIDYFESISYISMQEFSILNISDYQIRNKWNEIRPGQPFPGNYYIYETINDFDYYYDYDYERAISIRTLLLSFHNVSSRTNLYSVYDGGYQIVYCNKNDYFVINQYLYNTDSSKKLTEIVGLNNQSESNRNTFMGLIVKGTPDRLLIRGVQQSDPELGISMVISIAYINTDGTVRYASYTDAQDEYKLKKLKN